MFLVYKYCHNFKPGVLLSTNLINEVIEMADMLPVGEISWRFHIQCSSSHSCTLQTLNVLRLNMSGL